MMRGLLSISIYLPSGLTVCLILRDLQAIYLENVGDKLVDALACFLPPPRHHTN
jgi:hypothetical protein